MSSAGLIALDRNIRAVGTAYKQLMADWRDVLPTNSVCLTVPINYDVIGGVKSSTQGRRKNKRSAQALFNAGKADPNESFR